MKIIPLTRGYVTVVDDQDYGFLSQFKWSALVIKKSRTVYAVTGDRGNVKRDAMHRWILQAPAQLEVDHRDGDGLNNQRSNLRLCTHRDNIRSQRISVRNTSGFKGVSRKRKKWGAWIRANGVSTSLGVFTDPVEAAKRYDAAALVEFGEFAVTNKQMGLI